MSNGEEMTTHMPITDTAGIIENSFWDVFPDHRTEEELQEYKRLIGMPLTEDYEELIDSLT